MQKAEHDVCMLLPTFMKKNSFRVFGETGLVIAVFKGYYTLIERYEISLANYRGDVFNFYSQNVSPSER